MICTLARHQAQAEGYDDALMFDWRGQVAEATGANAFFVKDGALHTPTPDCFLNGITRQTVIDLARRRGIEVIERAIWPEELEGFEQFFLTGSAAEVTPVASAGPVELRGRRADDAAAQGLSRSRPPADLEHLTRRRASKRGRRAAISRPPAGASPSGKAPVFGTGIRRFESCRPSQVSVLCQEACAAPP